MYQKPASFLFQLHYWLLFWFLLHLLVFKLIFERPLVTVDSHYC